ncbi:MiaB/RimO family radical SAM methylthiotransferase [Poriferisphaera sp. WC338]|uniref:MiaB/RimO family radical SAM methylthiotransferase n=1 Tax=Poriferisphaera sp. WC338 TaxID=3425129 RepID=UPI003D81AA63
MNQTLTNNKSIYLETFGCQMNVLDTQLVKGQLQSLGYAFTDSWQSADVIIYNTCSVREHAENKVWSRVGEIGIHKKQNPHVILGIIGCMAERDGKDMIRKHPQIDLLCGPGELDKVPMLIDNRLKTDLEERGGVRNADIALQGNTHRRTATLSAAQDTLEMLDLSRAFDPDTHEGSAYVRITRGCNKFCTYCVVPNTRGGEVHRHPDHIVEECKKLVEQGVKEITLLGQTVNHYHYDTNATITIEGVHQPQIGQILSPNRGTGGPSPVFSDGVVSFADLLARIHDEIPNLQRLRFITSLPRDFGNDILQVIKDRPRICRYLHLPVQSGSNRILKLMNRGYTVEEFKDLIDRVREYLPDAELATDIIVGFPTETEEDQQQTAELLRYCKFKNSFIFKYSPRPGTVAIDRFEDDISNDTKKRRNNELLNIQSEISKEIHEAYVGKTIPVFVEAISRKTIKARENAADPAVTIGWEKPQEITQLTGRTDGDLIVVFDGDASLIGITVDITIDQASPLTLFGSQAAAVNASSNNA